MLITVAPADRFRDHFAENPIANDGEVVAVNEGVVWMKLTPKKQGDDVKTPQPWDDRHFTELGDKRKVLNEANAAPVKKARALELRKGNSKINMRVCVRGHVCDFYFCNKGGTAVVVQASKMWDRQGSALKKKKKEKKQTHE